MQYENQITVSVYSKQLVSGDSELNTIYLLNAFGNTNLAMPKGSTAKIEIFNPQVNL